MNRTPQPVIIIAGPTASGKSALALSLAKTLGGNLINGDSLQIYRGLPLLTAMPSAEDQKQAPHYLYGHLAPNDQVCSVAQWQKLALSCIETSYKQGRLPMVVGGTGLYLNALLKGLSHIPDVSPAVKEKSRTRHHSGGNKALYQDLQQWDPLLATRFHPNDTQRLLRGWEVFSETGIPLSTWQEKRDTNPIAHLRCYTILCLPPREALHKNAFNRLKKMGTQGAQSEVEALLTAGIPLSAPVFRALGAKEVASYLQEEITRQEAFDQAYYATRQYIKRQSTWFRHQLEPDLIWTDADRLPEMILEKLPPEIRNWTNQKV